MRDESTVEEPAHGAAMSVLLAGDERSRSGVSRREYERERKGVEVRGQADKRTPRGPSSNGSKRC